MVTNHLLLEAEPLPSIRPIQQATYLSNRYPVVRAIPLSFSFPQTGRGIRERKPEHDTEEGYWNRGGGRDAGRDDCGSVFLPFKRRDGPHGTNPYPTSYASLRKRRRELLTRYPLLFMKGRAPLTKLTAAIGRYGLEEKVLLSLSSGIQPHLSSKGRLSSSPSLLEMYSLLRSAMLRMEREDAGLTV